MGHQQRTAVAIAAASFFLLTGYARAQATPEGAPEPKPAERAADDKAKEDAAKEEKAKEEKAKEEKAKEERAKEEKARAEKAREDEAAAKGAAGKPGQNLETVVISGRRAALQSAQKMKQDAEEVVDVINADEIGKLPDRSVTEVLQRVVGVTIDRTMAKNDPEHFSIEGSGVNIRGLSLIRSELNGRDTFSANGGRALSFEDVPPELMSGVDVYKNPSAVQIEGAIGGLVNLRTAMPFDFTEFKGAVSAGTNYTELTGQNAPTASGLVANRWKTDLGEFGALLSLARSESKTRTDAFQVEPYFLIDPDGAGTAFDRSYWVPKGAQWRTLNFERKREGTYGALQWKKDDLESDLTYFRSKYRMAWNENALFAQSDISNIAVDADATYDANHVLQRGTLREAVVKDGGISFGADTRYADRDSSTQDLAWGLKWRASDRWSFKSDLQLVKARTQSFDSTVATGLLMPKETLDLSGSIPRVVFDATDLANLADPSKYFWAFTMEHKDKSTAEAKSWRGDAKFKFDDPVLNELQFGLRLMERKAVTTKTVPDYNWAPITQPWQKGWYLGDLAYLSDPRYSSGTELHQFNNFFGGQVSVPGLYMPVAALAAGYPATYEALHQYSIQQCTDFHGGDPSSCFRTWNASSFGTDPAGTNDQKEGSQAAYAALRFAFDDLPNPVDGNVGLRLVRTRMQAHGFTKFTVDLPTLGTGESFGGVPIPGLAGFATPIDFEQTYHNVLPSVNLRMKAADDLQFRLAWAQGIARPDFDKMQAYTDMKLTVDKHTEGSTVVIDRVNLTGTASGNPALKPTRSNQLDLTSEWYFSKNGSLTVALFNKQLRDLVVNQTLSVPLQDAAGNNYFFTVTGPVNGAKGHARGLELSYQQYFDKLPGWMAGLGVQANYTYIDSKVRRNSGVFNPLCSGTSTGADNLNVNINGCDTDGRSFGDLPLVGVSRNAYNLALLYDYEKFSTRIAYSWRSRYLQAVNVNGTQGSDGRNLAGNQVAWGLPVWNDDYGQVDAGVTYKHSDNLSFILEGQNLSDTQNRQIMQQHIGMMTRAVFYTGPRYSALMRYSF